MQRHQSIIICYQAFNSVKMEIQKIFFSSNEYISSLRRTRSFAFLESKSHISLEISHSNMTFILIVSYNLYGIEKSEITWDNLWLCRCDKKAKINWQQSLIGILNSKYFNSFLFSKRHPVDFHHWSMIWNIHQHSSNVVENELHFYIVQTNCLTWNLISFEWFSLLSVSYNL